MSTVEKIAICIVAALLIFCAGLILGEERGARRTDFDATFAVTSQVRPECLKVAK